MPLTQVRRGERKIICDITASGPKKRLLANLGLTRGACVTVITANPGTVIVMIHAAGIALSREIAREILVERQ